MNAYRIDKFLSHLAQNKESAAKFLENDPAFFQEFGLTEEEWEALQSCRVTKLYESGVHPLLMMELSVILKKNIEELYKNGY